MSEGISEQHERVMSQNEAFKRKAEEQLGRLKVDLCSRVEQLVGHPCSFIYHQSNWEGWADLEAWVIEPENLAPTASWSLRCEELGISPYFWEWDKELDVQGVWEELISKGLTWRSSFFTPTNDLFRVACFDGKAVTLYGFETPRINAQECSEALQRIRGDVPAFVADPKFDRTLTSKEWGVLDQIFDDASEHGQKRSMKGHGYVLDLDDLDEGHL